MGIFVTRNIYCVELKTQRRSLMLNFKEIEPTFACYRLLFVEYFHCLLSRKRPNVLQFSSMTAHIFDKTKNVLLKEKKNVIKRYQAVRIQFVSLYTLAHRTENKWKPSYSSFKL